MGKHIPQAYHARLSIAWNDVMIPRRTIPIMLLSTPIRNIPRAKEIVASANLYPVKWLGLLRSTNNSLGTELVKMGIFSIDALVANPVFSYIVGSICVAALRCNEEWKSATLSLRKPPDP